VIIKLNRNDLYCDTTRFDVVSEIIPIETNGQVAYTHIYPELKDNLPPR
jgi:hypothetical protein